MVVWGRLVFVVLLIGVCGGAAVEGLRRSCWKTVVKVDFAVPQKEKKILLVANYGILCCGQWGVWSAFCLSDHIASLLGRRRSLQGNVQSLSLQSVVLMPVEEQSEKTGTSVS
ncbi:MAG: hypothetical protein JOS17DRAFT_764156 [Linnemannia elongata]|nr:MAG: hypothetical protein JOS17DRAFT_764156 [Linnemannia elongata]